jgi:hypothetical protein
MYGSHRERPQVRSLPNFRPPHASLGFLVVCTNHSPPDAEDVTANSALTRRVVSRTQTIHWPVSKHRPEGMLITGALPGTPDLPSNIFYSSYLYFIMFF